MLELDGAFGEGGGQILRTSLALSLITGQPFRLSNIRANRQKPGLRRQHLTAVLAAAEIGKADLEGASVSSRGLVFRPRRVSPGTYQFAIGTGGSATLVLQTVLPPLMLAHAPSSVTVEGGTHNSGAPPFEYLATVLLPVLKQIGINVSARLLQHGFAVGGRGCIEVTVDPPGNLSPLQLRSRGALRRRAARALIANLPDHIVEREAAVIRARWPGIEVQCEKVDALGPANVVLIETAFEYITEIFTGFGERGVPAETVAGQALREATDYLDSGVPVGPHLADQLLLPMSLCGGGSFLTPAPTLHTTTNAQVIERFLPVSFLTAAAGRAFEVTVRA